MENGKIKVAQIIGAAFDGGVESCIMNYYTHIDRDKVQFDFFVENTSKLIDKEKIEELGGNVVLIPSYKSLFKYIKTLKKLFKEGNYDIVHSNMNALSVFTLYAAKKAGVKVRIAHSHSTSNKKEWKRNIIKNLLRPFSKKYATHYFACSELAGRWLFGDKTYDAGKVTLINNAIDLDKFAFDEKARTEKRAELGLEDKFVVGNIGRLVTQKNQTFLLDIFYEYQKKNPNSALLILGTGPLLNELTEKTHKLNLQDKVIFAGVHKDPEKYYSAMDCFVFPSLYEGLGMTLVEAQVSGLPCIASEEVPLAAKVTKNVEFLSLKTSAEDWADKIGSVTVREEKKETFIARNYDLSTEAEKLTNKYVELIS